MMDEQMPPRPSPLSQQSRRGFPGGNRVLGVKNIGVFTGFFRNNSCSEMG